MERVGRLWRHGSDHPEMFPRDAFPREAEPSAAQVPEIKVTTDQNDQNQLFPYSEPLSNRNLFC